MTVQAYRPLRRLKWSRFRRNRKAMVGGAFLMLLCVVAVCAPFLSSYMPQTRFPDHARLPPRKVHWRDADGHWRAPFVHWVTREVDMETFRHIFVEDKDQPSVPVRLFVRGDGYELLGVVSWNRHLLGIDMPERHGPLFLLGGDRLGRDVLSRLLFGGRVSLAVGLGGAAIVWVIGLLQFGLSGPVGGLVGGIVQRMIRFVRSIPTLLLWAGLSCLLMVAAALLSGMRQVPPYVYLMVCVSLVGWTSLVRTFPGNFLLQAHEGDLLAHVILAVPKMILVETALSFLGLGLRAPTISWGVLLVDAQRVENAVHPWVLWSVVMVVLTMLAFNLAGNGLRAAADPYAGMEGAS